MVASAVTIFTAPGTSKLSPTRTAEAEASRWMKGAPVWKVSAKAVSTYTSALREGGTFISARRLRMARMASITRSISFSSAGKASASSYTGQGARMSASPSWGRDCQISSVTKGMKGCSRLSVRVMTNTSTRLASAAFSPWSRALHSSIYQSQN